jgi:hypothetical protein
MDAREWFFRLGLQYLVAGRFSAYARLSPVGGTLLHHALEMLLKGYLSSSLTLCELKKARHRLPKLWNRFKTEVKDSSLNQYDRVVGELHRFKEIRYPDEIVSLPGMFVGYTFVKGKGKQQRVKAWPRKRKSGKREFVYTLSVGEIDELAKIIFQRAGINLKGIEPLSEDAKLYLTRWNESGPL